MPTQYRLTDTALKAGEAWGHAPIRVTLTDLHGSPVAGHVVGGSGALVKPFTFHAHPVTGEFQVDLWANADITPAPTYYTVKIGALSYLIDMVADGTLLSLQAIDPSDLDEAAASAAALAAETAARIAADAGLLPRNGGSVVGEPIELAAIDGDTGNNAAIRLDPGGPARLAVLDGGGAVLAGYVANDDGTLDLTGDAFLNGDDLVTAADLASLATSAAVTAEATTRAAADTAEATARAAAVAAEASARAAADAVLVPKDALIYNAKANQLGFSCAGDGTTDDTTAINSLVAAVASAGGGVLYFPPGTYKVTGDLTPKSKVSIRGAGAGVTIFKPTGQSRCWYYTGSSGSQLTDVLYSDFEVDGSAQTLLASTYDVFQSGVRTVWGTRVNYTRLYVHDTAATAVTIDYPTNCTITNCLVVNGGRLNGGSNPGGACIGIGTALTASDFEPCIVAGNICSGAATYGIFFESQILTGGAYARGVIIANNIVSGCQFGIGDSGLGGAVIANNSVHTCTSHGISLDGGTLARRAGVDSVVANNVVRACSGDGIHISEGTPSVSVGRIKITGNRCVLNSLFGIGVAIATTGTVSSIAITDNEVHANGKSGIAISGTGTTLQFVQIEHNRCYDNNTAGTSTAGIVIASDVLWLSLRFNTCYDVLGASGTQTYGIDLRTGFTLTDGVVTGNLLRGNKTAGLNQAATLVRTPIRRNVGAADVDPLFQHSGVISAGPSNATAETELVHFALPSDLAVGDRFVVEVEATAQNTTGSGATMQFRVRNTSVSGTAYITMDTAAIAAAGAGGNRVQIRFTLTVLSLTNSLACALEATIGSTTAGDGAGANLATMRGSANRTTIDLSGLTGSIYVTCQLSAASNNLKCLATAASLLRIPAFPI